MSVIHTRKASLSNLPQPGTQLRDILHIVAFSAKPVSTGAVAAGMDLDPKDVATKMSILQSRGFVEKIKAQQGKAGGSLWGLTRGATKLLDV